MPIYEFRCEKGHMTESLDRNLLNEDVCHWGDLVGKPTCGLPLKRVYSSNINIQNLKKDH